MTNSLLGLLLHGGLLLPAWCVHSTRSGLLAVVIWVVGTSGEGEERGVVSGFERVRGVLLLAVLWLSLGTGTGGSSMWIGAMGTGFLLRRWSIHTLGDGFSASLQATGPWVETGPYRFLRHPSEWGLVLATAGFVGVTGSSVGWGLWALGVLLPSIARIRAEDAFGRASQGRRQPQ